MNGLGQLIRRDCKLFFKDKGLFFSSLISPLILLVLYATFLGRIYRDSFTSARRDFHSILHCWTQQSRGSSSPPCWRSAV